MKNITKIIESNQQILDKCAYWFDTEKEVLKRYTQGVWKPITSTSSLSFSPLAPLSLEEDETGKKTLQLNYSNSDFELNDDNELTIKNSSGSKVKYYPKADYTVVQWCPKGKIDLDNDLSMPFIIPTRDRCPMIRFYCKELWDKYKMNTSISGQAKITYVLHDLVEETRQTILNNLTVVNLQLTKPWVCHGPFITWKIQNKNSADISCNCRKNNPYSYINGECMTSPVSWITTQDPVITSHVKQTINVNICPYITFRNPFIVYGGQVVVKKFTIKDDKITLEFAVEKIPANSKYYNPSTQSLVKYNSDGIQCNGSYVTKKRVIIFTHHGHNNKFYKLYDINLWNRFTRNRYYVADDRRYSKQLYDTIKNYTIVQKHFDSRKYINIYKLPNKSIINYWANNYDRGVWINGDNVKFAIQDVDPLYRKIRTGSEYTERYKQRPATGLKYLGVL